MSSIQAVTGELPRTRPSVSRAAPPASRPRVLVAKEQPALRSLLGRTLREAGYDVTELDDGTALWNELRLLNEPGVVNDPYAEEVHQVHLIVSDARMHGLDGLEVLARLRANEWGTPVILISADGGRDLEVEGARLGAAAVFEQPLDLQALVSAARALVDPARWGDEAVGHLSV